MNAWLKRLESWWHRSGVSGWPQRVETWWHRPSARQASDPFDVACACGVRLHGERLPRYQQIACTECGRPVFILSSSPYRSFSKPPEAPPRAALPRFGYKLPTLSRRQYLMIAGSVLSAIVLGVCGFLLFKPRSTDANLEEAQEAFRKQVNHARALLAEGSFQSALEDLRAASVQLSRRPKLGSRIESMELASLRIQAELLADLLNEPLEEILQRLDGLPPREGQAVVARSYRGRSVVFFATFQAMPSGAITSSYHVMHRDAEARVAWEELNLLKRLPLQEKTQLLFGARIASIDREAGGKWKIAWVPDSAILLTNPGAAKACCFGAPDETDLAQVLERQVGWVHELR